MKKERTDEERIRNYTWVISKSYELLRDREDEGAQNLCSYIRHITPEALEAWGVEE